METYEIWVERLDGPEEWFHANLTEAEKHILADRIRSDDRVRDYTIDTLSETAAPFSAALGQIEHFIDNFDGGQP